MRCQLADLFLSVSPPMTWGGGGQFFNSTGGGQPRPQKLMEARGAWEKGSIDRDQNFHWC